MSITTPEERERIAKDNYEAARAIKLDTPAHVERAHHLLTIALTAKPTLVNALILRSSVRTKLDDIESAIADISIAIELETLEVDKRRLASLYAARAVLFEKLGKTEEQLNDLVAALENEPDNGTWCYEIGQMYWRRGNLTLASQYWQDALDDRVRSRMTNTTRLRVLLCYGVCKLRSGAIDQAQTLFSRAQEEHETAPVLFCLGLTEYKRANYRTAADHLQKAVEMEQRNVKYGMCLVVCLFHLCEYHEAVRVASGILAHYTNKWDQYVSSSSSSSSLLLFSSIAMLTCFRVACELMIGMHEQALTNITCLIDFIEAHHASNSNTIATSSKKSLLVVSSEEEEYKNKQPEKQQKQQPMQEIHSCIPRYSQLYSTALYLRGLVHCAGVWHSTHKEQLPETIHTINNETSSLVVSTETNSEAIKATASFQRALQVYNALTDCHIQLGLFAHRSHDLYSALNFFHNALSCLAESNCLTISLLECIGLVYCDLTFYDNAVRFFSACQRLCPQQLRFIYRSAVAEINAHNPFGAIQHTEQLITFIVQEWEQETKEKQQKEEEQQEQHERKQDEQLQEEQHHQESESEENKWSAIMTASNCSQIEVKLKTKYNIDLCAAFYLHAMTLYMLQRHNDAFIWINHALEVNGEKANGESSSLLLLLRAKIIFKLCQFAQCIEDCNAVLLFNTFCVEALYLRGQALHSSRFFTEALADFDLSAQLDTRLLQCGSYHYARGVILANMNQMNDALTCFDDAIKISSNARSRNNMQIPTIYYHERAKARQVCGDYSDALTDYNVVLSRQPNNYHALVNRSLVLKELHDYCASARDWQRAITLDTQNLLCRLRVEDLHELHYIVFTAPGEEQMENEEKSISDKHIDIDSNAADNNELEKELNFKKPMM